MHSSIKSYALTIWVKILKAKTAESSNKTLITPTEETEHGKENKIFYLGRIKFLKKIGVR